MTPLFLQAKSPERSYNVPLFVAQNWPVLVAVALGLAAVYLLLPRVRRYPALFGVMAGLLALGLAGWWLIRPEPVWVETVLFYVFAGMAILFGGMMITQTQPVKAALSFAMVILSTCGLFLLQAAPFLMAATIIIYAGAIVVTFLFVIMLAQQSGLDSADYRSREPLLACVAGFVLLAALLCVLNRDYGIRSGSADMLARVNEYLIKELSEPEENAIASTADLIARIDGHVKKIELAAQAVTPEQLEEALGIEKASTPMGRTDVEVLETYQHFEFLMDLKKLVTPLKGPKGAPNYKDAFQDKLADIDKEKHEFVDPIEPGDRENAFKVIKQLLVDSVALGWRLQNELRGNLHPPEALPLSKFSGMPPNKAPAKDQWGKAHMPADNVAAIGESLFTDYLVAVELAAALLLVATIGAIAIAGRRMERLK